MRPHSTQVQPRHQRPQYPPHQLDVLPCGPERGPIWVLQSLLEQPPQFWPPDDTLPAQRPLGSSPLASCLAAHGRRWCSWGEVAICLSSCSPRCSDARVALLGPTSPRCPPASWHGLFPGRRRPSGGQSRSDSVGPLLFGAPDWALHITAWASPSCSCVWVGGGTPRSPLHRRRRWLPPWLLGRWQR